MDAALFISIIGALGTGAAAIMAWTARADSLKAEGRAESASKAANAAAERAAGAAERLAMIQSAIFDGPPWSMTWLDGDTYLLRNDSPVEALEVSFTTDPDSLLSTVSEVMPCRVGPRSAIKFMYAAAMSDGFKRDAIVVWKRPGSDEGFEWRHPLPTRP
ncbi:hypothetical protein [Zafaria sp. J156]|uniref:hypothetical protein n=1 Tax=Zafaria sp. J156 TaxID=3116490 RepID=UPI002E7755B0|nr:hypothetical protein [Zafaria sp. J156]MEE1622960.1 hypothetical protein [Zafaria sp. J156]